MLHNNNSYYMEIINDNVIIPMNEWNLLKSYPEFNSILRNVEEKLELEKAIEDTDYFVDYDEIRNTLVEKNVHSKNILKL